MADDRDSGRTISPKMILVAILVVIVVILAIVNSQDIKVDFVVGDFTLPLFVVIVGSALIGLIVGYFLGRREKAG
jgi:putative membrane protein